MSKLKLFDLPESLVLFFLQYVIGPNQYQSGSAFMRVNKFIKQLVNRFIKQEIRQNSRFHSIQTYQDFQCTLLLYDCIFSGNIYIIGGTQDDRKCDVFNTHTGKFKRICSVGNKRSEEFDVISYCGYLFAISGIEEASIGSIEIYDMFDNAWYPFPSLPKRLVAPASIVIQNQLLILGGVDRTSVTRSNSIYILEHDPNVFKLGIKPSSSSEYVNFSSYLSSSVPSPPFGEMIPPPPPPSSPPIRSPSQQHKFMSEYYSKCYWTISPLSMSIGRSHHSVAYYQNFLWIAGGITTGQWIATNSVEILNPQTGQSIIGSPMLRNRLQPKLLVIDDCLYAIGGDMEGTIRSISSIERYDLQKPGWMFVTFFHEPRRRSKCAIASYDSKIFVFGGSSDGGNTLTSWDYYNTRTKVWASQIKAYLQDGFIPSSPLTINGSLIPVQEVQYVSGLDLSTIPGRPQGMKAALASPVVFE